MFLEHTVIPFSCGMFTGIANRQRNTICRFFSQCFAAFRSNSDAQVIKRN